MTAPTPGAAPSKVFPLFPALALISIKKKKYKGQDGTGRQDSNGGMERPGILTPRPCPDPSLLEVLFLPFSPPQSLDLFCHIPGLGDLASPIHGPIAGGSIVLFNILSRPTLPLPKGTR